MPTSRTAETTSVPREVYTLASSLASVLRRYGVATLRVLASHADTHPALLDPNQDTRRAAARAVVRTLSWEDSVAVSSEDLAHLGQSCCILRTATGATPQMLLDLCRAIEPRNQGGYRRLATLLLLQPTTEDVRAWQDRLPTEDEANTLYALRTGAATTRQEAT